MTASEEEVHAAAKGKAGKGKRGRKSEVQAAHTSERWLARIEQIRALNKVDVYLCVPFPRPRRPGARVGGEAFSAWGGASPSDQRRITSLTMASLNPPRRSHSKISWYYSADQLRSIGYKHMKHLNLQGGELVHTDHTEIIPVSTCDGACSFHQVCFREDRQLKNASFCRCRQGRRL